MKNKKNILITRVSSDTNSKINSLTDTLGFKSKYEFLSGMLTLFSNLLYDRFKTNPLPFSSSLQDEIKDMFDEFSDAGNIIVNEELKKSKHKKTINKF